MTIKQKVHILGGGMSGLATAYHLSCTQALRDRFEVVVYQRGWRLGGKCASSRATREADPTAMRIEEHGLHVWFGFYHNAFAMLRGCFDVLGLGQKAALQATFMARDSTPLMEKVGGAWTLWPLDFPADATADFPGVDPKPLTLQDATSQMMDYVKTSAERLAAGLKQAGAVIDPATTLWLAEMTSVAAWTSPFLTPVVQATSSLFAKVVGFFVKSPTVAPNPLMTPGQLAWLAQFDAGSSAMPWARVQASIQATPPGLAGVGDELRRLWITVDLVSATLRGLAVSAVPLLRDGLGTLDPDDFRHWLARNGANGSSVDSALVRALYDLCFAYTDGDSTSFHSADFAAGTALRCAMRITMGYTGSVCYVLRRGMGEAVVAPIYQALSKNGVKFRFFTRIDSIALDAQGRAATIRMTQQAPVSTFTGAYEPMKMLANKIAYWPDGPDFQQLAGLNPKAMPNVNFESDLGPQIPGAAIKVDLAASSTLPDKVVVAMSVGSLDGLIPDLAAHEPRWARMLTSLRTVATQSAQVWMNKSLAQLGYAAPNRPPAMIAAPEPMDVWADMSHLIGTENWAVPPQSVHYICGPMRNPAQPTQACALAMATSATSTWLQNMAGSIWPGACKSGAFNWDTLVASNGTQGAARLQQQYIRANFEASERYVLSVAGSSAARLAPDALAGRNIFLAGDWTSNGLDAGCVEAAVMSGVAAARAIRGDTTFGFDGAAGF